MMIFRDCVNVKVSRNELMRLLVMMCGVLRREFMIVEKLRKALLKKHGLVG